MKKIIIPSFKVGQTIIASIDSNETKRSRKKKVIEGSILYVSSHHITIKCENYNRTVNRIDIKTGNVKILEVKNS